MKLGALLRAASCCLALVLAAAGCGPSSEQLTPVKGKVSYRGHPCTGGTIVFIPDAARGTRGNLAVADIQPDGTFALKTNDVLGAVAGHHRVTVSWVYTATSGATPQSVLPTKYRDPQLSGLTREVVVNKTNAFEFDLD
ncbi:MAG TPA: hypothetical protein VE988_11590 [Gemmataceae bacterium]|nr:hypothetical protein [Gemmataceae bacterium]